MRSASSKPAGSCTQGKGQNRSLAADFVADNRTVRDRSTSFKESFYPKTDEKNTIPGADKGIPRKQGLALLPAQNPAQLDHSFKIFKILLHRHNENLERILKLTPDNRHIAYRSGQGCAGEQCDTRYCRRLPKFLRIRPDRRQVSHE
ncbi:hypothetical protein BBBOND_0103010 [Babesia bigemina]|uniref:Uncharacterized protein n=1 Tax=Babesia bigemina TaxID=5866 RepID=A0A061D4U7_BABBI|nr:hypothetical protein BBBOND_0103010 [Babesia bigemina]CDR93979.1 hypothetical protein BBBOND_0103010 [Babesia bigemina]|eukprot:XP_012766165.1 hypothetical protein BBBOND_0103010 [Babesia bigemina]